MLVALLSLFELHAQAQVFNFNLLRDLRAYVDGDVRPRDREAAFRQLTAALPRRNEIEAQQVVMQRLGEMAGKEFARYVSLWSIDPPTAQIVTGQEDLRKLKIPQSLPRLQSEARLLRVTAVAASQYTLGRDYFSLREWLSRPARPDLLEAYFDGVRSEGVDPLHLMQMLTTFDQFHPTEAWGGSRGLCASFLRQSRPAARAYNLERGVPVPAREMPYGFVVEALRGLGQRAKGTVEVLVGKPQGPGAKVISLDEYRRRRASLQR